MQRRRRRARRRAASTRVRVERPPRAELGDYSTNAPLLLAPRLGRAAARGRRRARARSSPRGSGDGLERTEVAGPGFLNLHLSDEWFVEALAAILAAGERFGALRR